jgi:hypothetical protein
VTSGTVSLCTVSGIEEGGTVPYCTESERTGTVTATSDFCSKSKCDLLSAVGDINKPGFCVTGSGKFSIEKLPLLFNVVPVRYGIVQYGTGTESGKG